MWLVTGVHECICVYVTHKVNSTGCTTIFMSAQWTVMFFPSLIQQIAEITIDSSKWDRQREGKSARDRDREKETYRICWSRLHYVEEIGMLIYIKTMILCFTFTYILFLTLYVICQWIVRIVIRTLCFFFSLCQSSFHIK